MNEAQIGSWMWLLLTFFGLCPPLLIAVLFLTYAPSPAAPPPTPEWREPAVVAPPAPASTAP